MDSLALNIQRLAVQFPPFIMAVIFHEYAHGLIASRWGDKTAKEAGRLTLNPVPHVDVIGTLVFPIINMVSGTNFLFGWAKPVPIDPRRFRKYRHGLFWVALAGPGMNVILALVSAAVFCMIALWVPDTFYLQEPLLAMAYVSVSLNYALGIFNLIPLPPLDGSKIIESFLSIEAARKFEQLARYSFFILMALLLTGALSVLSYPIKFCADITLYFMERLFHIPGSPDMTQTQANPKTRKTMLSAVQPTNGLTLGTHLGAIKNWVRLQRDFDCLFFAVDLHAMTARQDPKDLRERTYRAIATYIAAGIDPEHALLFVQSHVPEHAELGWILTCHTYMGELGRMTQYKDKSAKQGTNIGAGIFAYPTLMAADILLYGTDLVPVGQDQKQHLELTRDVALRMNNLYGEDTFTLPEAYIPPVGARIMSLQDPTSKMSKSDPDPGATIFLDDSDDVIRKKLKRAVTDSGTEITYDDAKPGVQNLLSIQSALTGKPIPELVASYTGKMYGHLKVDTAELVVQAVSPIRQKTEQLMADRPYLDGLLSRNAERARERAHQTLARVYDRIGLIPAKF